MRVFSEADEKSGGGEIFFDVFVRKEVVDGNGLHEDERGMDGRGKRGNDGNI